MANYVDATTGLPEPDGKARKLVNNLNQRIHEQSQTIGTLKKRIAELEGAKQMTVRVNPILRHSSFGDWYYIKTDADAVIIATNSGVGLKPRDLCLPHQVYVAKVRELERKYGPVTIIPVHSNEYVEVEG